MSKLSPWEATASAMPHERRVWRAFHRLTATLLLAADFGGACQAQAPRRAALPGVGPFAPLQPEPGDIWAEVRGWHQSQRGTSRRRRGRQSSGRRQLCHRQPSGPWGAAGLWWPRRGGKQPGRHRRPDAAT